VLWNQSIAYFLQNADEPGMVEVLLGQRRYRVPSRELQAPQAMSLSWSAPSFIAYGACSSETSPTGSQCLKSRAADAIAAAGCSS
jgi:hypothetical protein